MSVIPVRNAIISVYYKTGLEELARQLLKYNVTVYATGGTAQFLEKEMKLPVKKIEALTQFPEMMDGRVKTLHPKVFGGILARRDNPKDIQEAKEHGIVLFDLVVGNLYPFAEHLGEEATAQSAFIDIGGPSMLRAAAKNSAAVTVTSDPGDYALLYEELEKNQGGTTLTFRRQMAARTFARTASYDALIASEWTKPSEGFPQSLAFGQFTPLRYGENPHQAAVWAGSAPAWKCLQGKELSFNNLLDAEAAVGLTADFSQTAVAIIKHNNPCGVAVGEAPLETLFQRAFAADEKSAFGGIVSVNREVNAKTAEAMSPIFLEVILAPKFSPEALEILGKKKNLRLIEWPKPAAGKLDVRRAMGGWLLQQGDNAGWPSAVKTVTQKTLSPQNLNDLQFAWLVCKHVRSNAIVVAKDGVTLGIGGGQVSRVDAVEIALKKAKAFGTTGAVLASDAFFPFRDNIDALKGLGIAAVVQPGGSQRDAEVIQACDEQGIAMAFTSERHFRH